MASIQERGAGLSKILGPSRFVMDSGSRERFRDAGWYLIQHGPVISGDGWVCPRPQLRLDLKVQVLGATSNISCGRSGVTFTCS